MTETSRALEDKGQLRQPMPVASSADRQRGDERLAPDHHSADECQRDPRWPRRHPLDVNLRVIGKPRRRGTAVNGNDTCRRRAAPREKRRCDRHGNRNDRHEHRPTRRGSRDRHRAPGSSSKRVDCSAHPPTVSPGSPHEHTSIDRTEPCCSRRLRERVGSRWRHAGVTLCPILQGFPARPAASTSTPCRARGRRAAGCGSVDSRD